MNKAGLVYMYVSLAFVILGMINMWSDNWLPAIYHVLLAVLWSQFMMCFGFDDAETP